MHKTLSYLALGLLVAACATTPDVKSNRSAKSRGLPGLAAKGEIAPPTWVEKVPQSAGARFFVGEGQHPTSKERALEQAWVSAFVRTGMTEFPELAHLTTKSVEGLKDSSYERRFVLNLEQVNWAGMVEATELGSPYINVDEETGHYHVYRLLKWPEDKLVAAKRLIQKKAGTQRLPHSPEWVQRYEGRLVSAVQAIQAVNDRIQRRDAIVEAVLSQVKCGVTVRDLVKVLGKPDRVNPINARLVEKEFYWGSFRVSHIMDDPTVAVITRENGPARRRVVCQGTAQARLIED